MKIVEYTQARLNDWYAEAKRTYNVIGFAKVEYSEEDYSTIHITYTENGVEHKFSVPYVKDNEIDYAFNVWAEQA